jgi:hypothetical protein
MIASIAITLLSCFDKISMRSQEKFLILSLSKDKGAIRFEATPL